VNVRLLWCSESLLEVNSAVEAVDQGHSTKSRTKNGEKK
jgi:hypothetical protein